jgi:dTDP-4-amino-4,6-dideoxygalactose transaminase
MILAHTEEHAARLRRLRNHGQTSSYVSQEHGWNSRLDEIQAAILRVKLRFLPSWQAARRAHAREYDALLNGIPGVVTPKTPESCQHVFHQYTIRVPRRDAVQASLAGRGIGSRVYYPVPLPFQPLYAALPHLPGDFPAAERAASEVLSLPMYPELQREQISRVAEALAAAVASLSD